MTHWRVRMAMLGARGEGAGGDWGWVGMWDGVLVDSVLGCLRSGVTTRVDELELGVCGGLFLF